MNGFPVDGKNIGPIANTQHIPSVLPANGHINPRELNPWQTNRTGGVADGTWLALAQARMS